MKTLLSVVLWISVLGAVTAKEKPFAVTYVATIGDRVLPRGIAKIGETGTATQTTDHPVPKNEPPLGWAIEITPTTDKENKFAGQVVIRHVTMSVDRSEFPVSTFAVSTFCFSLPVNGKVYCKQLSGLGKVTIQLDLIDAYGTPLTTEQTIDVNRSFAPQPRTNSLQ